MAVAQTRHMASRVPGMTARDGEPRRRTMSGTDIDRSRTVELVIIAVLTVAVLVGAAWQRQTARSDVRTALVRVESGETLWSLAQSHPVEGLTTEQTADLIAEMNGVTGPIHVGSELKVPSEGDAAALAMR